MNINLLLVLKVLENQYFGKLCLSKKETREFINVEV